MERNDYIDAVVEAGFVLSSTLLGGRLAVYRRSFNSVRTEGLIVTDTIKVAPKGIEHFVSYNYTKNPEANFELRVTMWLFANMEFSNRANLAVRDKTIKRGRLNYA